MGLAKASIFLSIDSCCHAAVMYAYTRFTDVWTTAVYSWLMASMSIDIGRPSVA